MESDNEAFDIMRAPGERPMERIREGMRVVDAAGEEIGTVEFVQMGDSQAVTLGADAGDEDRIVERGDTFDWGDEPDLPESLRARLMRTGFIKVDVKGLFTGSRYVATEEIDSVAGETVTLAITRDQMAEED
jgi:hypothetical protein